MSLETAMSPSVIPPPPPPHPISTKSYPFKSKANIIFDGCNWALEYPELQKACFLSRVCTTLLPKICSYRNIRSILQEGPKCGLTAVAMICDNDPDSEVLLEIARSREYTNLGEMFSAMNLYNLLCDIMKEKDEKIVCQLYEGRLNCSKVKEILQSSNACMLVPYDPDFSHAPCLKMGHKAHWALVIGYIIDNNDEFYVIARHGKAKNLAVWPLKDLSESNSNLVEFAQPKGYPDSDFIVPPGGIGGKFGIRNRAIIVQGIGHEIISIS